MRENTHQKHVVNISTDCILSSAISKSFIIGYRVWKKTRRLQDDLNNAVFPNTLEMHSIGFFFFVVPSEHTKILVIS